MLKKSEKFLVLINVVAGLSCLALATKFIFAPYAVNNFYGEEYKEKNFTAISRQRFEIHQSR